MDPGRDAPTSALETAAIATAPDVPRQRRRLNSVWRFLPGLLSVICGGLIWEGLSAYEVVNPLFLPRLTAILSNLWDLVSSGEVFSHLWATISVMGMGLGLATLVAIPLGIAAGTSRIIDMILAPYINALNAVPRAITFMPLAIVIFGISPTSRIFIVFISTALPLIINITTGVRTVDPNLLDMSKSFGVSTLRRFRSISLPSTVPYMFSGFRLAIGQALIAVVIAELFASTEGIGFLLARASARYNTERLWAMILVLAVVGVSISAGSRRLERHFDAWRPD